ncbi:PA14 domain-containing protein [Chondromyces apiculatus]|nr:PA14 domain-containing protein [Chondromyces apiculatus]
MVRPVITLLAASLLAGCTLEISTGSGAQQPTQGKTAGRGRAPAPPPRSGTTASTTPATNPAATRQLPKVPATATKVTSANVFGSGTTGPFQGLAYVVPESTERLPTSTRSLVPFATVYTDRFAIQSQEFSSGFPGALVQNEYFFIQYEGRFEVPKEGKYQLQLTSDDGAKLFIDDRLVVNNDGVHTEKTAEKEVTLTAGAHWLKLDYFQAARGKVALQVLIGQNGKLASLVGVR